MRERGGSDDRPSRRLVGCGAVMMEDEMLVQETEVVDDPDMPKPQAAG